MFIYLTTIKEANSFFDVTLAPLEVNLDDETIKLKNSVQVKGKIKKGIVQTDINGAFQATVEVECARCLQPTELNLNNDFSAAFVTPENYTQAREAELNAEDLEVSVFEGDKINLSELVREQILLTLPERNFCREDCKGLCEKCSANRNLINCNCDKNEVDPRWAALKNLR